MYEICFYKYSDIHPSGNVVFQYIHSNKRVRAKISNELMRKFGFEIPVIVFDTVDLKEYRENPLQLMKQKIFHLYVTFLYLNLKKYTVRYFSKKAGEEEFVNY